MIQLFLQRSAITADDWAIVYSEIVQLAEAFPLRLLRIESYNGFEYDKQDKDHFDLLVHRGQADEHLSFYGDWMSWTSGTTMRFYKNWSTHCEQELAKVCEDTNRSITWYPPTPFKDDGSLPNANGACTVHGYIDTEGALYQYAVIAIGILLENRLPGRAFLIAHDVNPADIEQVVRWLENHLGETVEPPVYFDKKRLITSLEGHYDDPKDIVERMEHLYRKQFKRNMAFALEHIGYEPTFRFYAGMLSKCQFGTFGFSDVLNSWIAATQELESTLDLIEASKRLCIERNDTQQAAMYDLNKILKELLHDFILWSPQQREELERFYTNRQALETGDEDLWGSILRMTGNRVDICPIVVTADELFETFMYHDPQNGSVFRRTIDEWLEKNSDAFGLLMEKLSNDHLPSRVTSVENHAVNTALDQETTLLQYPPLERFLIQKVISVNPAYFQLDTAFEQLIQVIRETTLEEEHLAYVEQIRNESNADKKAIILRQLKEKRNVVTAGPDFERWLNEEEDPDALLFLRLLMSLKIYDRDRAYARYRILQDNTTWNLWRKDN